MLINRRTAHTQLPRHFADAATLFDDEAPNATALMLFPGATRKVEQTGSRRAGQSDKP